MIRITRSTCSAAIAALSIGALGTGVALAADGSASANTQTTTMHLVAHHGQEAFEDLGTSGPGLGDTVILTQRLTLDGTTVGHLHNVGVEVDASRHLFQATGTLRLGHGTVEFAGLVSQTPEFVLAITGGTGRYQGATGQITFDFPHQRQLLTVTLQP